MRDFVAFAADVHRRNAKWWHTPEGERLMEREPGELLMLAVTELAEAVEGIRKSQMDDKLPHRLMEEVELADTVIRLTDTSAGLHIGLDLDVIAERDGVHVNKATALLHIVGAIWNAYEAIVEGMPFQAARFHISDAISSCYDYAQQHNLDLDGAIDEKLIYNDTRADHTYAARAAAGGKAF